MTNVPAVQATVGEVTSPGPRAAGPSVLASFTSKDKVISGTVGTNIGARDGRQWNPWFKGSGPLDEDDATAPVTLADLSGMRSTAKVSAGTNLVRWEWKPSADAQRVICRRVFADPLLASDSIAEVVRTAVAAAPDARKNTVRDSVVRYLATKVCGRHHLPEEVRPEFDELVDYGKVVLIGLSAEYGRTTFKYADTVSAAFRKQTKEPWAASAGIGRYLPKRRVLVAGTLRYERSYEGGTARDYCIPVGGTSALQCRSVALGVPEEETPVLLTGEARWFISEHAGLSPRVTGDLSGKKGVGVELPILVRQAADQGFTSAFSLGWRSKTTDPDTNDRFYVSLVVGVTFGIGLKL